ncbi:MAG: gluconolactonase [Gammaproteobacteria bacterium]|jgi:DNA-binding beta-propeller fold protein YncE|nr:gluconolactonase [Gammaproteobacteria bacterium]
MRCRAALAGLVASVCLGPHAFAQKVNTGQRNMALVKTIAHQEGDARLDYASIDGMSRRLYVARGFGVTAVDLDTEQVTRQLVAGQHVHAVIPLPGGRALSTNGDTNTATLFEGSSGKILAQIETGRDPDAAVFDPMSGLVFVMNAKDGDATLVDPVGGKAVGRLSLGGKPEFAVVDGHGRLFVNIEDQNKTAVIDTVGRKILGGYALPGCEGPSALGIDIESGVLVAACANRTAVALRAADGGIITPHLRIDRKPDAVIFDAANKTFYIPCGRDGTLAVISGSNDGAWSVRASVSTAVGAHTGALDTKTGRLYLPTADYQLTLSGIAPADGTFRILVLASKP